MRILLLAPHSYYIDRGTPIDVDILLRALSQRGDTVDAVVYHDGEDRVYPNVRLHRIRRPPGVDGVPPGFSSRKLWCDLFLLGRALGLARREAYDVVHAGEEAVFIAMLLKFLFGVPYVYDMDSSIAQQMVEKMPSLGALSGFLDWCEARAIRGSVAAAPVCNALADLARARGARRVVTLHDISQLADPDRTPTGELRERVGARGVLLMYVGNLEVYQGVDLLLESLPHALKRQPGLDLVVAGGDPEHIAGYSRKAQVLGVAERVHFIGPWPAARLDELLAEADILVAPRTKGVNTPMKVFPYMHSGKPLLVTDLPTHSQILTQDVARLAPADPEAFGAAIAELAGSADLRARLGSSGRRFVEENHVFAAHQARVDALYAGVGSAVGATKGHPEEASGLVRGNR